MSSDRGDYMREYMRAYRLRQRSPEEIPHGVNGYTNCGCRCDVCGQAKSASNRAYRQRRKATAGVR